MPTKQWDVAVVMVIYNGIHPECLPTLKRAMDTTELEVGVVVVDNASPAFDAYSYVSRQLPEAQVVLRDKNLGFGNACNRGAAELNARHYLFLNPDTKIEDTTLFDTLVGFLQAHPKVGIVAPRVRYMDGSHQQTARRFPAWYMPFVQRTNLVSSKRAQTYKSSFLLEHTDPSRRRMVDWVQGSAFLIDGALFHEVGGFDERYFMYFEDIDLCRACWQRGRPIYYLPEAEVYHVYGKGSAKEKTAAKNLLSNKLARVHVDSWLKYLMKWGVKQF